MAHVLRNCRTTSVVVAIITRIQYRGNSVGFCWHPHTAINNISLQGRRLGATEWPDCCSVSCIGRWPIIFPGLPREKKAFSSFLCSRGTRATRSPVTLLGSTDRVIPDCQNPPETKADGHGRG